MRLIKFICIVILAAGGWLLWHGSTVQGWVANNFSLQNQVYASLGAVVAGAIVVYLLTVQGAASQTAMQDQVNAIAEKQAFAERRLGDILEAVQGNAQPDATKLLGALLLHADRIKTFDPAVVDKLPLLKVFADGLEDMQFPDFSRMDFDERQMQRLLQLLPLVEKFKDFDLLKMKGDAGVLDDLLEALENLTLDEDGDERDFDRLQHTLHAVEELAAAMQRAVKRLQITPAVIAQA